MTDTKSKRRGWVKNAAIIFLAVLLVLTFFSNTFLNRSLPEVAAQYPTSGSIQLRIRGTGTISSNQVQNVSISESRKVKGIAIRAGDVVEKGQPLFLLAETASEELAAAQEMLESLEEAYADALLDATLPGDSSGYEAQRAQMTLQEAVEARDKAKKYEAERKPLEDALEQANRKLTEVTKAAGELPEKSWLDAAKKDLERAQAAQTKAEQDFAYYAELHGVSSYETLADQLDTLQKDLDKLWEQYDAADAEYQKVANATNMLRRSAKIGSAVDGYLKAGRKDQQREEINKQYLSAKELWDTLSAKYYNECVRIERENPLAGFRGDAWMVNENNSPKTFNDAAEYVVSTDLSYALIFDDPTSTIITKVTEAGENDTALLTWAYRSLVWWQLTDEAVSSYNDSVSTSGADADATMDSLDRDCADLWAQIQDKEKEYDELESKLNDKDLSDAYETLKQSKENVKRANDVLYQAQLDYDNAAETPDADVEAAQKTCDQLQAQLDALAKTYAGVGSYADETRNVISAQEALESIYRSQASAEIAEQKGDRELERQRLQVEKQRETVEELQSAASETIIYAPCSGTVTAVNVTAGDTTIMNQPMAEIELTDQGHTLTFDVTKEQASRVNVGDQAEILERWGVDIRATLVSIATSKNDPGSSKTLVFDLKGEDVVAGQSLTLSVGQKSQNYEVIVPNAAVKQDAAGKFVLTVQSRSTPLGNRYYVNRVDVEVLASDDNNSALKGNLTTGEFVIITATAPIANGDMVRLPE